MSFPSIALRSRQHSCESTPTKLASDRKCVRQPLMRSAKASVLAKGLYDGIKSDKTLSKHFMVKELVPETPGTKLRREFEKFVVDSPKIKRGPNNLFRRTNVLPNNGGDINIDMEDEETKEENDENILPSSMETDSRMTRSRYNSHIHDNQSAESSTALAESPNVMNIRVRLKLIKSSKDTIYRVAGLNSPFGPRPTRIGKKEPTDVSPKKKRREDARSVSSKKISSEVKIPNKQDTMVKSLEDFRKRLHASTFPERMPCREQEFASIEKFIRAVVAKNGIGQAMYISGVPGTGKTDTVQSVVKKLQNSPTCPKFKYISVNAMELADPKQVFVEIYKNLCGKKKRISAKSAQKELYNYFENNRSPIVILVDELDQLFSKRQEFVYDIFNWTTIESARVSVLAIANTLDLPERMLCPKVTSRIGSSRVCFQPYEFQQIEKIIDDKLGGSTNIISQDSIQFAARKVASVTGDLRKAMQMISRSIDIAIKEGASRLELDHVRAAIREASSTLLVNMVKDLSKHGRILFQAALSFVQSSGLDEFTLMDLYTQYSILCTTLEGIAPVNCSAVDILFLKMIRCRLFIISPGTNLIRRRVRLGVPNHEAQYALRIASDECRARESNSVGTLTENNQASRFQ